MDSDVTARISALELRYARQRTALFAGLTAGVVMGVTLSYAVGGTLAQPRRTDEILTVRGLVVVDERGTVVRIWRSGVETAGTTTTSAFERCLFR